MIPGQRDDTPLNTLEDRKLDEFESALAELYQAALARDLPADLIGPWSKLALVLTSCRRNDREAVPT